MTNKEIVKNWFAAIDAKDFEAVKKMMHQGHSFENPMTPTAAPAEQHLGMIQMMTSAFSGKHQLDHLISEGDYVAVRGRWIGKHTGEFNGIAATGKPVEFSWIDIFHIVDGKVERELFEMNPGRIAEQISNS